MISLAAMQPEWAAHILSNNIRDPSSEIPTNVPRKCRNQCFLKHFAVCRSIPNWSIIEASCNTSVLYAQNAPLGNLWSVLNGFVERWMWKAFAHLMVSLTLSLFLPVCARTNANMKFRVKKSTRMMNTIQLSVCTKVLEGRTRAGNGEPTKAKWKERRNKSSRSWMESNHIKMLSNHLLINLSQTGRCNQLDMVTYSGNGKQPKFQGRSFLVEPRWQLHELPGSTSWMQSYWDPYWDLGRL